MTNHGDDCYFFYYSTCSKGDSCPFRHCEAAMGSETVCNLWQENRCFRSVCKFRHMEIKKKRKEIACYWENQPGGCQKPHCAFHHEKPRFIDGTFVPPSKEPIVKKDNEEEPPQEETPPVSNPTNPQLRGVIKADTQENVPSPTHPPVVINPVDDEDDEDDQFSEEGEESSGISPRKQNSSNDRLNFGVSTLEEIRLRKALKASLRKAGYESVTSASQCNSGVNTEKENIQSFKRPGIFTAKNDPPIFEETGRRRVADRLGRITKNDIPNEPGLPLKRKLAERLGEIVDSPEESVDQTPQKAVKPVRERLGLTAKPNATEAASPSGEANPSGEVRIKTLEEIRQEKAAKSLQQGKGPRSVSVVAPKNGSSAKQAKPVSGGRVKTFSEVLHEKKKLEEEKKNGEERGSGAITPVGNNGPSDAADPVKTVAQVGGVRVKTLEEIRKEKVARMQAQAQAQETPNDKSQGSTDGRPKRRLLRINKTPAVVNSNAHKKVEVTEKTPEPVAESGPANRNGPAVSEEVKVKTFEEIMREKRLRQQQGVQAASVAQPDDSSQPGLKRAHTPPSEKPAATAQSKPPPPTAEPSTHPKAPVRHRITLKPKATSPASVQEKGGENLGANSPKKRRRETPPSPDLSLEEPQCEIGAPETPKMSPGQVIEAKVRPKLNVKPSVVKPAAQVKPGHKRKASGSNRSAVAAVKPLNTAPEAQEVDLQEPPQKASKMSAPSPSAETDVNQRPVRSSGATTESEPSRRAKEAQTQLSQRNATALVSEPLTAPQSHVAKTPVQSKVRRVSVSAKASAASSSSTVDDFEELMNEFTDDRLESEMELDPGKGEDDLLLELSEMIDS